MWQNIFTVGLLSAYRNFRLKLSTGESESIWRAFGSFKANLFAMNGNSLIENSYEKNVDVYAVIKKIVDVSKSIPWIVEEMKPDGTFEPIKDSTLHELMYQPNLTKGYTWNDIEEQLLIYLLASGNAYLYGQTGIMGATILEVDVLPANNVEIKCNNSFFLPELKYKFAINGKSYEFEKESIAHIKLFNPVYTTIEESYYGLSPIQVASMVIQTGNDRWEASAALNQNRGAIGLITDKSGRPMTPTEAAKVQSDFDRQTSGTNNFGRIKVTNKDLNYIQMAMSPSDLKLIEMGVVNLRAICNLFGLDSSLFNDPDNKTYNNRNEAEKALYTNAVKPVSDKMAEIFTMFLCKNHFPGRKVRMRQDFENIEVLQENFKEKAEVFTTLKEAGIVTANEAREKLKYDTVADPAADKLVVTGKPQFNQPQQ